MCFSRFLNYTNATKSSNASHLGIIVSIRQVITLQYTLAFYFGFQYRFASPQVKRGRKADSKI